MSEQNEVPLMERDISGHGEHAAHIVSMQPFLERFTDFLSERKPQQ